MKDIFKIRKNLAIWLSLGLIAFFWLMEYGLHYYLVGRNTNIQHWLVLDPMELHMMVLVTFIVLGFGVFAHIFITKRKQVEEIAKRNSQRYQELFDSMLNGFALHQIVVNESGEPVDYIFINANRVFLNMVGSQTRDLIGRRVTEVLPAIMNDSIDWINIYSEVALNNKRIRFEQYSQALGKWLNISAYSPVPGQFATIIEDITERKNIERVMWENQERTNAIFDSIQMGIMVIDRETHTISYVNQAAAKMIGTRQDKIIDQKCHKYICPAEAGACPITDKKQTVDNSERCLLTIKGQLLPVIKTVVETEIMGRPVLVESFIDISDRKALESQNELKAKLLDAVNDAIIVHDFEGNIEYFNMAAAKILGLSREEMAKINLFDMFPAETLAKKEERLREIEQKGEATFETSVKRKDGTILQVETHSITVDLEGEKEILSVSRDITERVRAESKMRQLSAAVEQSPSVIVITDLNGNIEYVNPAFTKVTGYEAAEVMGKNPRILKSGEISSDEYKKLWETISAGKEWRGEFHNKKKNGELYWEQAIIGPIKNANGRFDRYIAIKENITERKEAEAREKALFRISQASSVDMGVENLYSSIHQVLGDLLNVNNFYIAIYNKKTGLLEFPYFVDEQDSKPEPRQLKKGLTEYILRTGKTLLASPEIQKELSASGELEMVGTPSLDWLGVPLKIEGSIFGALVIQTYDPQVRFGNKEKQILEFVSDQVAMAIEKNRAREDVIASEEKYRELIENQGEGIAVADMNDVFTFVNPAAETIFGVPRGSLVGRSLASFLSPQQMVILKSQNNLRAQGEKSSYELMITRPDGSLRTILVTATPQYYKGQMTGTFGIFRDISDLKAAEEELKASEAINRTMIESAGRAGEAIMLVQDTTSVRLACIMSNLEAVRITGYSQNELLRKSWLDLVHPDFREQSDIRMRARLAGQDIGGVFEISLVSKYGNIIPIEITGSQVRYQGRAAVVSFFREITERKKAEAEREKLIGELQEALNRIKTLKGLIPICSSCKKIRNDGGYWQQVEEYVAEHTEADFSHGLCDECAHKLYPEIFKGKVSEKNKTQGDDIG